MVCCKQQTVRGRNPRKASQIAWRRSDRLALRPATQYRGAFVFFFAGCDYDLCEICYKHHAEGWASAVQKRLYAKLLAVGPYVVHAFAGVSPVEMQP